MLPRIISATGAAITSDEVAAVGRIIPSYAQSKFGVHRQTDQATGVLVEYHADKKIAFVTPGGYWGYVGVAMPNPVPYRGLSMQDAASAGGSGDYNYVALSDGTILLQELYTIDYSTGYARGLYELADNNWVGGGGWNGGMNVWMFEYNSNTGAMTLNHKASLAIPEDCIYPAPQVTPPDYIGFGGADGLSAQWNSEWNAGVTAFKARRQAWLKKNSDEFLAAVKGNFQPVTAGVTRAELQTGSIPASWDNIIKTPLPVSVKTYQPTVMAASYVDSVTSDTSANLSQGGTMVTTRIVTFEYVDAQGNNQTTVINGTLTQVVVQYVYGLAAQSTYLDWYVQTTAPSGTNSEWLLPHQFIKDTTRYGLGLLWRGVMQQGYNANSSLGMPDNPLVYFSDYPVSSNTLVGTAPQFILDYHSTVTPQYDSTGALASTAWNNSALYNVKQIELCLFGPVKADGTELGLFADPTDADGCTTIAYYGKALYNFDWTTGALTFSKWKPQLDNTGNSAPTIIPLPTGYAYINSGGTLNFTTPTGTVQAYNCVIGYDWSTVWPDVLVNLKAEMISMKAGAGDQVLYTLIQQPVAAA